MTTCVIYSIFHISYKKNIKLVSNILYKIFYIIYMIFDKEYKISNSLLDILINYLCFINS